MRAYPQEDPFRYCPTRAEQLGLRGTLAERQIVSIARDRIDRYKKGVVDRAKAVHDHCAPLLNAEIREVEKSAQTRRTIAEILSGCAVVMGVLPFLVVGAVALFVWDEASQNRLVSFSSGLGPMTKIAIGLVVGGMALGLFTSIFGSTVDMAAEDNLALLAEKSVLQSRVKWKTITLDEYRKQWDVPKWALDIATSVSCGYPVTCLVEYADLLDVRCARGKGSKLFIPEAQLIVEGVGRESEVVAVWDKNGHRVLVA